VVVGVHPELSGGDPTERGTAAGGVREQPRAGHHRQRRASPDIEKNNPLLTQRALLYLPSRNAKPNLPTRLVHALPPDHALWTMSFDDQVEGMSDAIVGLKPLIDFFVLHGGDFRGGGFGGERRYPRRFPGRPTGVRSSPGTLLLGC